MIVDAVAGGELMGKNRDETYELLEEMASNDFDWQVKNEMLKKVVGMHVLDAITTLQAQLTSLRKQLGAFNVSDIQFQPQVCDFCR